MKIRIFQHRMLIHFNDYPITKCRIADILQYFSKGMHLSFIVSKPLCLEALKKLNSDLAWVVCCLLLCKHSLLYHCNMSSRGNFQPIFEASRLPVFMMFSGAIYYCTHLNQTIIAYHIQTLDYVNLTIPVLNVACIKIRLMAS